MLMEKSNIYPGEIPYENNSIRVLEGENATYLKTEVKFSFI